MHQFCLVALVTEFGSMVYVSWAETAAKRRVADAARVVAVKLFMMISWVVVCLNYAAVSWMLELLSDEELQANMVSGGGQTMGLTFDVADEEEEVTISRKPGDISCIGKRVCVWGEVYVQVARRKKRVTVVTNIYFSSTACLG